MVVCPVKLLGLVSQASDLASGNHLRASCPPKARARSERPILPPKVNPHWQPEGDA